MRVLIYKYKSDLAPIGGPNGYCFNILKELERRNTKDIFFLENKIESKYKANSLKKYFQTFLSFFKTKKSTNFDEFDVVHFHSTKELYKNRKNLKHYDGKILLTTHSPVPYHMEMVENIKNHHKILGLFLRKHSFSKIDSFSFNRANIILLPCKEAEESYYYHWKHYKKLHQRNEKKYVYIPTGIVGVSPKIQAEDYRKSLGYSKDDFIVSYVGRHNEVKGYDRIIKIAKLLNNGNIKFLIGGKEFPMSGPNLPNWKEIGWTNDPYSLVNCSNVFILPNRETYFDIVLLEVLSLGKTCIISNTGGNKVVLDKGCEDIYKFDSEEECAEIIKNMYSQRIGYEPRESIQKLFKENYTISLFVDQYLNMLEKISEDRQ